MKNTPHAPNVVLMIKPIQFGFNKEAFATNKFQQQTNEFSAVQIQQKALLEFNNFVEELKKIQIEVLIYNDSAETITPDSIFPNNWISTHTNGMIVTYPMLTKNRRLERRKDIVFDLLSRFNYSKLVELAHHEEDSEPTFLEGTGSMVLDHQKRVIYAAVSPRTNEKVLKELAKHIGYRVVSFTAYGIQKELIYHTNVMMCIGETFVIIGADTIDEQDKEKVLESLKKSNKTIIQLTNEQIYEHFAGNMLQLRNKNDKKVLVMSKTAYKSLTKEQLKKLLNHNNHLLVVPIPTIEKIGGGSARCMLAEVYTQIK